MSLKLNLSSLDTVLEIVHWDCPKGTPNPDSMVESRVINYTVT
jgi:hypothetical protein